MKRQNHEYRTETRHERRHAGGHRSIAPLLLLASVFACGQAAELPSGLAGSGGSAIAHAGAAGAGEDGSGGSAMAQAGAGGAGDDAFVPPTAPECTGQVASAVGIQAVPSTPGPRQPEIQGTLVERGYGAPAEPWSLPPGAASVDALGWLLLEEVTSSDAGAAVDAGAVRRWTIVGPREVAEVPVAIGDTLQVAMEETRTLYLPGHSTLSVRLAERVVLFAREANDESYGEQDGFGLTLGPAVCQRVEAPAEGCVYHYSHELDVVVPGGASASLGLGEARIIGDYHVAHETYSMGWRRTSYNQSSGQCNDRVPPTSQLVAILRPNP